MKDHIHINRLKVSARVGVPDEERAQPQELELSLRFEIAGGFRGLDDDVTRTLDYDLAARRLREWCGAGEHRLIETLAEELAAKLFEEFDCLERVRIEVRKFVLPDCESVGVTVRRRRGAR